MRVKYFRYWESTHNPGVYDGHPHLIQYIVDYEGTRSFDWLDSTFDADYVAASENSLKPYASAYFEYDSSRRIEAAWFNGECGCSGASNGLYRLSSRPSAPRHGAWPHRCTRNLGMATASG